MNYMIYHEGTGTWIDADEAILVSIDDLPPYVDEWDDFIKEEPVAAYKIAVGRELL